MSGRLEGKIAMITGTGGGQGRAAALLFAAEGATIAGGDLKVEGAEETAAMVREAGGSIHSSQPVDYGDAAAVNAWVEEVVGELGGVDVLYNNASRPHFAPVAEMSDEQWHETIRNELDLVFFVTRAAWPHLAARDGASIINIASMQGVGAVRPAPGGFAHAATKHGVIGLTRELANEGGPVGIRVNSISPGLIATPATQPMFEIPEIVDRFLDHQIVKRPGRPEDIAQAALFLASEDASFITGENLVVDGGYTIV